MKNTEYINVKKIILRIGIGQGVVNELWINRYYEVIKKFAHEMYFYGKKCYILINKTHFNAVGEFVAKNCNDKARSSFKELKALQWKDIDETWINDKEVDPFDHIIKFANKSSTTTSDAITHDESYDVPDTQRAYVLN